MWVTKSWSISSFHMFNGSENFGFKSITFSSSFECMCCILIELDQIFGIFFPIWQYASFHVTFMPNCESSKILDSEYEISNSFDQFSISLYSI
jgi:hypothetical protein